MKKNLDHREVAVEGNDLSDRKLHNLIDDQSVH